MLSSALVVFREVFEIVLIVGIILAATKNMPHRGKAVGGGFAAGLCGSALVALTTGQISAFAEGMGQEYFNAGILLTAAAFIGWTVIWMKKNARNMKKHFESVGNAVAQGRAPAIALSAIIALAILREGSEIVLFIYGMLAAGQSPAELAGGAALGLIGGTACGLLLYTGLIKLSVRAFFQVTSAMLILLVAGMVSQAFGFLVAAGNFTGLSQILWDSSAFISGGSFVGKSLHTLIGYTARPTTIQFIVYVATLVALFGMIRMIDRNISFARLFRSGSVAGLALLLAAAGSARPALALNVTSPYVHKGELELEWKGEASHDDDNEEKDGAWKQKGAVAYGVTERLQLEVEGEVEHEGGEDTDFSAVALEGKVMLTEPGQYWLDAGIKGEYEINTTGGPDKIEGKLLLAKDIGKFTHRTNLILEREVGDESSDETEAGLAWSSRYRYNGYFQPGFEYYADFGEIGGGSDFDEQSHRLGPVFYGKSGPVKYEAGYLFGLSDAAADGTFKAILEYEYHF